MQATDAVKVAEYTGHRWMHAVFPSGREIYHSWFGGADGVAIDGECFVRDAGITYRAEVRDPMPMGLEGAGARHSFTCVSSLGETPIDCEIVADSFQSLMGEEFFGVQWDSPNPACLAMSQAFVRYRWGDRHQHDGTLGGPGGAEAAGVSIWRRARPWPQKTRIRSGLTRRRKSGRRR